MRVEAFLLVYLSVSRANGCQTSPPCRPDGGVICDDPEIGRNLTHDEVQFSEIERIGLDVSSLTSEQVASFLRIINTETSACDNSLSLAKSLVDPTTCHDSILIAKYIVESLGSGLSPEDTQLTIDSVARSLRPRTIDTSGRPILGNANAPVTIVVFADFQCPHCRAAVPVLKEVVGRYGGKAKLIFKHYPIVNLHPRAKAAAIAAEAAHEQGKFWEVHDRIFANQKALAETDLRRYAIESGVDIQSWEKANSSADCEERVERDYAHGVELEIQETPAIFINGRMFNDLLFGYDLTAWIDDALNRDE